MFLGFLKFTNYGLIKVPLKYHGMNKHYGLFYKYNNDLYGNMLSSTKAPINTGIKDYYIHIPNIKGNMNNQYLWDTTYKLDNRVATIFRERRADDYLTAHYDRFQDVLSQINPNGNLLQLTQNIIDLTQF